MPDKPESRDRFLADVLSFGWVLPTAIAVGAGLGWGSDRLLHTFPVLTILFGLLGMGAGMRQVLRESDRLSREEPTDRSDSQEPPRT